MAINYNINKKIQDKGVRKLLLRGGTLLLIVVFSLLTYLSFNGKHNKITYKGIETNIPEQQTDTTKGSVTVTEVNGDYINGNKTVNNNFIDTSKSK